MLIGLIIAVIVAVVAVVIVALIIRNNKMSDDNGASGGTGICGTQGGMSSGTSSGRRATPIPTPPSPPKPDINISVQQNTGNGIIRVGGTYSNADHISLDCVTTEDNTDEIRNQNVQVDGAQWYYDKKVVPGKKYRFAVKASNKYCKDPKWAQEDNVVAKELSINQILADSSNYRIGRSENIEYLVIHYTANNGDTAEGNCKYFQGPNRNASAHYFVSESQICQSVLDKDTAWSVGDGKGKYGITNSNSMSIEMCNFLVWNETVINQTIPLIREKMAKYSIPIQKVVRHYDASRKKCPAPLIDEGEWQKFKNKI